MQSRARWATDAVDLSNDLNRAAQQLTLGALADKTGLSARTIEDSLTREKISDPDNPRGALDRPKYSVGGDPLWSPEQLQDYFKRKERQATKRAAAAMALPLIAPEESEQRGLIATLELAELLGIHVQTVRRWEANFGDTYPPAVARRSRDKRPGVPEHVRELTEIIDWIKAKNAEREARGEKPIAVLPVSVAS